jgi:phosphatidate cytidylyltransferase
MADSDALRRRLTLGPILIAALAAVFWADALAGETAPFLFVLALLLAVRGAWEYVDLLRARGIDLRFELLAASAAIVVASNWIPTVWNSSVWNELPLSRLGPPFLAYAIVVMALLGNALLRYRAPGGNLERLGVEVLGVSYLGVLLSATAELRWIAGLDLCYLPLASVVVVTKCGDTAAYFAGHAIGGRKLSPLISPGKTWAGAFGALAGAAAGGWLCLSLVPNWFSAASPAAWYWSLTYGVLIGGLGIVGDLAESLIKRDVGRKDSAPLLPGFGGLLDLLDSVIFVGPAAYLLWLLLPLPR